MLASDRPSFKIYKPTPHTLATHPTSAADHDRIIRQFITRVGGLENARRALDMLAILTPGRAERPAA